MIKRLCLMTMTGLALTSIEWVNADVGANRVNSTSDRTGYFELDCRFREPEDDCKSDRKWDHDCEEKGDKDSKKKKDSEKDWNDHHNPRFCYASAYYSLDGGEFKHVQLDVGCDHLKLYNGHARIQSETTLDRISALRAATPAVEVFPQGQLSTEGTYTSVLDIPFGRFKGLCYVHEVRPELKKS
jgi:hypothetical protein